MPWQSDRARLSPWLAQPTGLPGAGTKAWLDHTEPHGSHKGRRLQHDITGQRGPCRSRPTPGPETTEWLALHVCGSTHGGSWGMRGHCEVVGSVFQGGTLRTSSICPIKATKGAEPQRKTAEVFLRLGGVYLDTTARMTHIY